MPSTAFLGYERAMSDAPTGGEMLDVHDRELAVCIEHAGQ